LPGGRSKNSGDLILSAESSLSSDDESINYIPMDKRVLLMLKFGKFIGFVGELLGKFLKMHLKIDKLI
jgi:hypothetical protein